MLLMRPDAAHRVTVFGSTRKSAATSPGVSRRSLLPSTFHPSYLRFRSMSSVWRKHPFTSLFSPKMGHWCWLSASRSAGGTFRPAEREAAGAVSSAQGERRNVAGWARRSRGACWTRLRHGRALLTPDVIIWFRIGVTGTTHRGLSAIPVCGDPADAGPGSARIAQGVGNPRHNAKALGSGAAGAAVPLGPVRPGRDPGSGQARRVL
jgi:hypothetical protein